MKIELVMARIPSSRRYINSYGNSVYKIFVIVGTSWLSLNQRNLSVTSLSFVLLFKYYDFFWNCVCKLCIQFIVIQVFLLSVSRSQFSKNSIDKTAVQVCNLDERWKEITIFDGRLAHLFVEIITRKKFLPLLGLKSTSALEHLAHSTTARDGYWRNCH